MADNKDFVEVDDKGFVTKAQKVCFVLSYEDLVDKLGRKITANEWEEICDSFEDSLQECNWQEYLEEALRDNDLLQEDDDDDDEDEE